MNGSTHTSEYMGESNGNTWLLSPDGSDGNAELTNNNNSFARMQGAIVHSGHYLTPWQSPLQQLRTTYSEANNPNASPTAPVSVPKQCNGYSIEWFIDTFDPDFICPICLCLANGAVAADCCSNIACTNCVELWYAKPAISSTSAATISICCPLCNSKSSSSTRAFKAQLYVDRKIRSLLIHCPNKCDKRGLMIGKGERSLKEHLLECSSGTSD